MTRTGAGRWVTGLGFGFQGPCLVAPGSPHSDSGERGPLANVPRDDIPCLALRVLAGGGMLLAGRLSSGTVLV